jgi:hypothetical protein
VLNLNPEIVIDNKKQSTRNNLIHVVNQQYGCFESFPFHQTFLFSSAKPCDFDGILGTGLPVSMYTPKTLIDKCRFNVTQRLQCTDNYFFKIKFVLFLYLLLSVSWKENDLSWYISVIRQTVRYWTPVFTQPFSWRLHITITYHLRLWYVDVVTVIA